jgi:hypothetical protein
VTFGPISIAYVVGLSYLSVHFLLYVAILRDRPLFQTEKVIFFCHFISALVFTAVALFICGILPDALATATALGLVALHGIYSISFLELWSLAQGSYSISILTELGSKSILSREKLIETFFQIGNTKKHNRTIALSESVLIRRVDDRWQLTHRGRLLTRLFTALLSLSDIRRIG